MTTRASPRKTRGQGMGCWEKMTMHSQAPPRMAVVKLGKRVTWGKWCRPARASTVPAYTTPLPPMPARMAVWPLSCISVQPVHVLEFPDGELGDDLLVNALQAVHGGEVPVGGAGGEYLQEAEAHIVYLLLKGDFEELLGLLVVGGAGHGTPGRVGHPLEGSQELGGIDGIAVPPGIPAPGGGGGLHPQGGGGGHLAAGGAVVAVVHHDHGDALPPQGGVHGPFHAYGQGIAVPLIGKDHQVGPEALDGRGDIRRAAVGTEDPVHLDEDPRYRPAGSRIDPHGLPSDTHLLQS